ncbi:unnamed protein product [Sphenostylis stenocarpa]|uniref:Uncharacterized protein n=1 Tax=Sphenostylis stenocarpa TaxID=92480 RepID=A0AA86THL2_9FABA|nr:unnamed protein product [Sphenostylis stenocarpa]
MVGASLLEEEVLLEKVEGSREDMENWPLVDWIMEEISGLGSASEMGKHERKLKCGSLQEKLMRVGRLKTMVNLGIAMMVFETTFEALKSCDTKIYGIKNFKYYD